MKIYILVIRSIKDKQWTQNYIPDSCYINKDNAIFIQNKMKKDFDSEYELKEMSIRDSTFINQDVDPLKYKWGQA